MAKILELEFTTEYGKTARVSVENPKEPVEEAVVKQSMEAIIGSGIFMSNSGNYAAIKGARVVERNVTEYEIV